MECKVSTVKAAMNKYTHDSDQVRKPVPVVRLRDAVVARLSGMEYNG